MHISKVKICGIRREVDIAMVNQEMPDYIGFVFAKSKRRVLKEEARHLRSLLDNEIQVVGVFVNETVETIVELLEEKIIDIVQLHGQETEADICKIKESTQKPVIKAVAITKVEDILAWENSEADFLLLDHGKGGTGQVFDWKILESLQAMSFQKLYFVAGGLDPNNVSEVLGYRPYGVDVSSGVEIDGVKDEKKIKAFMQAVVK